MKRILLLFGTLLLAFQVHAQELPPVDSTLLGKDLLQLLGPGIQVQQNPVIRQALTKYVAGNATKPLAGYRIRVFNDNSPSARSRSENIENSLIAQFPEVAVYRRFESPNYQVLIGDFRTKDEALRIYNALKGIYPTAYILKETINYPR